MGIIVPPASGSASLNPVSGELVYTPFDGIDFALASPVNITVTQVNDVPLAFPDTYTIQEDTSLTAAALLGADIEDSPLAMTYTITVQPANADAPVSVSSVNEFTYTPRPDFNTGDSETPAE